VPRLIVVLLAELSVQRLAFAEKAQCQIVCNV
jgi:hypothetical protein